MKQYRFIDVQKATFPIRLLCRVLSVPESSYFDWHNTGRKSQELRDVSDAAMVEQVVEAREVSDARYGAPRVHAELADGGVVVSKRRVAELMRNHRIQGLSGCEHCTRTTKRSGVCSIPDLVNRGFHPDQVWYGDITYIWVNSRFWYLATVIDACTKQVLGWKFADNMETPLIEEALKAAVARRSKNVEGIIFHSDRGSQYMSKDFAETCKLFGVRQSMGATGVCWDNAGAESFFATLKRELVDRYHHDTADQLHTALFGWIETWYNTRRRHSTLNMKTPDQHAALKTA